MKNTLLIFTSLLVFTTLQAQIPNGYYDPSSGKQGTALRIALTDIIDNNSTLDYGDIYGYFSQTDQTSDQHVWDMYSFVFGSSQNYEYSYGIHECDAGLNYNSEGDCFNKEHIWPQSYFNQGYPMRSDLHMVYPTDGWVNNKRSNLPFGNVNNSSWVSSNGSQKGSSLDYPGYSGEVFEPIDSFKGDIARAMLYTCVRYFDQGSGWTDWEMADGAQLNSSALSVLRAWHDMDPVSAKEISRNNAVYNIQGNRNPFVDYPDFVECIWGSQCKPYSVKSLSETLALHVSNTTIKVENVAHVDDFIVYDMLGNELINNKHVKQVSIENLRAGMYIVELCVDAECYTQKFVKP